VLVAEDNKMSAKILDMLIKKAGHQCTVASDGQQAFDAYSATPFDIIFMDCRMPIVDGWEATKLIREKERKEAQEKVSILFSASSTVFSTPKLILRSD
jgi:CheY-like chemotaxis protein